VIQWNLPFLLLLLIQWNLPFLLLLLLQPNQCRALSWRLRTPRPPWTFAVTIVLLDVWSKWIETWGFYFTGSKVQTLWLGHSHWWRYEIIKSSFLNVEWSIDSPAFWSNPSKFSTLALRLVIIRSFIVEDICDRLYVVPTGVSPVARRKVMILGTKRSDRTDIEMMNAILEFTKKRAVTSLYDLQFQALTESRNFFWRKKKERPLLSPVFQVFLHYEL